MRGARADRPDRAGHTAVRWGILGAGGIANWFAGDLAHTPGATLQWVGARDPDRAAEFGAIYGAVATGSYEEMLADPELEIVYIASTHDLHHEHTRLVLEAGKHALVEKPFTMNAAEARDLIALARERGLFLMEAVWTLCNPLFRELRSRVKSGAIGEPRLFTANIGPMGIPAGLRMEDPERGGSFILENLMYPVSILRALAPRLADADDVFARAGFLPNGVDIAATITLGSTAGAATMGGSFVPGSSGLSVPRFQLAGSGGWLEVSDSLFNPGRAVIASGNELAELEDDRATQRFRWEIEEAGSAMRSGRLESEIVPLEHTLAVMEILDRACESAGVKVGR